MASVQRLYEKLRTTLTESQESIVLEMKTQSPFQTRPALHLDSVNFPKRRPFLYFAHIYNNFSLQLKQKLGQIVNIAKQRLFFQPRKHFIFEHNLRFFREALYYFRPK